MNGRSFPIERIDKDGNHCLAAKIECCQCEAVAFSSSRGGLNPKAHEQHFRGLGWSVGNGPRRDMCPECQKRKPNLKVVKMEPAHKAEAPREMSREDRRIITSKLDDVYLDGKYSTPWTDAAVARDLGVPRAWVSEVRDQFFGPEGSNPEFDDFLIKAAPVIADLRNLHKSVHAQLEQCRAMTTRVEELERMGRRIEKEIGRA